MWNRLPTLAVTALLVVMIVDVPEAPATVAEQRARLPPAAECHSAVAGKWKALNFDERRGDWYTYTLEVSEDPQDETKLTGMIYVDTWVGPRNSPEPPVPCRKRFKG